MEQTSGSSDQKQEITYDMVDTKPRQSIAESPPPPYGEALGGKLQAATEIAVLLSRRALHDLGDC